MVHGQDGKVAASDGRSRMSRPRHAVPPRMWWRKLAGGRRRGMASRRVTACCDRAPSNTPPEPASRTARPRHAVALQWPNAKHARHHSPFTRASSAGLAGNRTAACLRLAEPSSAGPCQAEQHSEPEGPRSRVPGGIQGIANPFHTPSASAQACRCKARCVANSGSIGKQRNAVRCMLERSPCGAIRPVRTLRCDFSTGPDMPSKPRLDCGPA